MKQGVTVCQFSTITESSLAAAVIPCGAVAKVLDRTSRGPWFNSPMGPRWVTISIQCGGVFVWVCVWVSGCVCLAYTSEDFHMKTLRHTEDSTPSEDPKTGPRKTLVKNAENVMFYHVRGVRAPRTSMDFQPHLIYEDIRVLGSISKASRGVCVCVCVSQCFIINLINYFTDFFTDLYHLL